MIQAGADEGGIPAMKKDEIGEQANQLVEQEGHEASDKTDAACQKRHQDDAELRGLGTRNRR